MRALFVLLFAMPLAAAEPPKLAEVYARKNLVAWCIVPFDSQKRTPKQRVEMLQRLGFTQFAYDWRAEHLPSFPEELELLKKANISLKGVWFPAGIGKDGEFILDTLAKQDVKTELWTMLPQPKAETQDGKVKEAAELVKALAKRAAKQGCKVGVYNHGGWTGEPENMVAVVKACGESNVGIVYNLHHGHAHLPKLEEYLKLMKPHLYCVNLNGMAKEDPKAHQIAVINESIDDRDTMKFIASFSGCEAFGILGHTNDDVEERLQDNLDGLVCIASEIPGERYDFLSNPYLPASRTGKRYQPNVRLAGDKLEVTNIGKLYKPNGLDFATATAEQLADSLRIYIDQPDVGPEKIMESQKLPGKVEFVPLPESKLVQSGKVVFTPDAPLVKGKTYRAIFIGTPSNFNVKFFARFTITKDPPEK